MQGTWNIQGERERKRERGRPRRRICESSLEILHFLQGQQKKYHGYENSQALPARPSLKGMFGGKFGKWRR
jgi:hypothetical protein